MIAWELIWDIMDDLQWLFLFPVIALIQMAGSIERKNFRLFSNPGIFIALGMREWILKR